MYYISWMHKFGFFLSCTLSLLFFTSLPAQTTDPPVDIYIVAGQTTSADITDRSMTIAAHPRLVIHGEAGQHEHENSAPLCAFGSALTNADPDTRVLLVPVADRGTSLQKWVEADDRAPTAAYDQALTRVRDALRGGGHLRGVLWQPCTTEIARGTSARKYADGIARLVRQFRHDLDRPELPFLVGQLPWLGGSPKRARQLNRAVRQLTRELDQFYTVSLQRPRAGEGGALLDSPSARRLGRAYARRVQQLEDELPAR
jgi:hypothetical protein